MNIQRRPSVIILQETCAMFLSFIFREFLFEDSPILETLCSPARFTPDRCRRDLSAIQVQLNIPVSSISRTCFQVLRPSVCVCNFRYWFFLSRIPAFDSTPAITVQKYAEKRLDKLFLEARDHTDVIVTTRLVENPMTSRSPPWRGGIRRDAQRVRFRFGKGCEGVDLILSRPRLSSWERFAHHLLVFLCVKYVWDCLRGRRFSFMSFFDWVDWGWSYNSTVVCAYTIVILKCGTYVL